MASWDVFHADSLELERGLSSDAVRAALASGVFRDDDLVRPSGTTTAWARLGDFPELAAAVGGAAATPAPEPTGIVRPPSEEGPGRAAPAAPGEPGSPPAHPSEEAGDTAGPRGEPTRAGVVGPTLPAAPPRVEAKARASSEAAEPGPPARIRARRPDMQPPPEESSDFEVGVETIGPAMPGPTVVPPPGPTPPAWIELGGETDDVTFPVLRGREGDAPVPGVGTVEEPAPWTWPDDDDDDEPVDEEESQEHIVDLDDQLEILDDDDAAGLEILDDDHLGVPSPTSHEAASENGASQLSLPVVPSRDWNEDRPPVEGAGEEAEDFTLSRGGPVTVEELDLAPMVDVAFQLVLFFMVTATTVLYKSLEIPKPTTDQAPEAVAQGHSRSVDDLQKDYILVEIDTGGAIKIDREPVAADVDAMAERLRVAREKTGRKIMLLSADYSTAHRNAVLAYDAAIEIGMGIAIARPTAPQGPGPSVFGGASGGNAAPGGGKGATPRAGESAPSPPRPPAASGAPPGGGPPF